MRIEVNSMDGSFLSTRRGFAEMIQGRFGSVYSRAACDELYDQLKKLNGSASRTKMIHDPEVGRFFAYDLNAGETGAQSLAVALRDKYKLPRKVPAWLARRAVIEPIELALCGYEVTLDQVECLCDLFPQAGVDPDTVWSLLVRTVAGVDSAAESSVFEAEVSNATKVSRARRI